MYLHQAVFLTDLATVMGSVVVMSSLFLQFLRYIFFTYAFRN